MSQLLVASDASGKSLKVGFADEVFEEQDANRRAEWLDRSVDARARIARLTAYWRNIAPQRPATPTNPADPAYDWAHLDRMVRDASERGLQVALLVTRAPRWAEGQPRPSLQHAARGTWKPNPEAFGEFAEALGRRYSGGFPTSSGPLPRIPYFQVWAEPNHVVNLNPQREGDRLVSPEIYRRLLNEFHAGLRKGGSDAAVIAGGTAPYGDPKGQTQIRPLVFLRQLFCLKGRKKLKPTACDAKASFEILGHNPINLFRGPDYSAHHPDDATVMDFRDIRRVLRAAERKNTVEGGRHGLWATELWWESKPPFDEEDNLGVKLRRHARWVVKGMYNLSRQGAQAVIWLQIVDSPPDEFFQTGMFFHDGRPKPAFKAVRFPFIADRAGKRRVRLWAKSPGSGRLRIERKGRSGWRTVHRERVRPDEIATKRIRVRSKEKYRARLGGLKSLPWKA